MTMAPHQDAAIPRRIRSSISDVMEQGGKADDGSTSSHASESETVRPQSHSLLPPTQSLPLLVFIDMFAVSLVVPLLFQYYKNAGVTSATQREFLSSVFSSSQIVGGLALGALTDAQLVHRKTVLYVSFGGSALAYACIVYGGFHALIFSRVLVGLVKQTMTVTTSMLTKCTTEDNRAKYMGRLESSSTAAWIAGPSVGALLYKYVDHKAPALLACALFVVNLFLAAVLLRDNENMDAPKSSKTTEKKSFWQNLKSCFSSKALGSVIASTLIFSWVNRATSYSSMGSYYEDMYGVEPHHRGYIQSYQQILGFLVQSTLIGPILTYMGGERRAACIGSAIIALATFCEMQQSFPIFLIFLSPAFSLSTTMMNVSLRSLLTTVAPSESIFSVFAALDVLQNASAVTVPFYRTTLFRLLGGGSGKHKASMEGDPDPVAWVFSGGLHWAVASVCMAFLLLPSGLNRVGEKRKQSKRLKRI